MSFRDKNGTVIKEGDIVACTITMNFHQFFDTFSLKVVRRGKAVQENVDGRELWLDGITSYGRLKDQDPRDMLVLTPGVNLRAAFSYFSERQRQYERDDEKLAPREDRTDQGMFQELVGALLKVDQYNTVTLGVPDRQLTHLLKGNTIHEISRILNSNRESSRERFLLRRIAELKAQLKEEKA